MVAWHAPAALVVVALLAWTKAGRAEVTAPKVVVVATNPDAPFVRRLAAELGLFGYRVELELRGSSDADLPDLLERSGGAALIAVDQGQTTAEVIVGQSAGQGRSSYESERLDPRRGAETNAAILAERFRARLTELGIAPAPTAEPLPPSPRPAEQPPRGAPPPEPRLWLVGSAGGTGGGLGFLPEAHLELRALPVRWLSTSILGGWSPWSADVRADEGRAKVRVFSTGLAMDLRASQRSIDFGVGLGVLLVAVSMTGQAEAPWGGRQETVLVPAAQLQGGGGWRISPRISAELRGFVGMTAPSVGIRFDGRTVAAYGQPYVGASVGLGVGVF